MKDIIQKFYKAFHDLDGDAMANCYHKDIVFEDPAFGQLTGERAGNMWRMLCHTQKGNDFRVIASGIEASGTSGKAHWEANYSFGPTGRKVHNIIDAQFEFKDNLIVRHIDDFDLYRWSKQAFGFTGILIGWSSFFKSKLNVQTNNLLSKYESNKP